MAIREKYYVFYIFIQKKAMEKIIVEIESPSKAKELYLFYHL